MDGGSGGASAGRYLRTHSFAANNIPSARMDEWANLIEHNNITHRRNT
jgi:hypothetical protein